MALHVECPNGHPLRLGDTMAGKRVRCPKCRQIFLVEVEDEDEAPAPKKAAARKAPSKPAPKRRPRDDDDERPAKKKKNRPADDNDDDDVGGGSSLTPLERRKLRQRDKKERLKRVFTGLTIAMFKLWSAVVLVLIVLVRTNIEAALESNAAVPAVDRDFAPEAVEMFRTAIDFCIYLLAAMVLITPAIGIASSSFCILTPRKSESGGSIMTSLVFDVLPLIAAILIPIAGLNAFELDAERQARFLTLSIVGWGCFSLAALFMFIIFLRQMSIYLQESKAAADALNMLAWLMLMTASGGLLVALLVYIAKMFTGIGGGAMSLGVTFLITLIWFALLYYVLFNGTMNIIKVLRENIGRSTGLITDDDEEEEEEEEEEEDDDDE